jgi:hypothetical protein
MVSWAQRPHVIRLSGKEERPHFSPDRSGCDCVGHQLNAGAWGNKVMGCARAAFVCAFGCLALIISPRKSPVADRFFGEAKRIWWWLESVANRSIKDFALIKRGDYSDVCVPTGQILTLRTQVRMRHIGAKYQYEEDMRPNEMVFIIQLVNIHEFIRLKQPRHGF